VPLDGGLGRGPGHVVPRRHLDLGEGGVRVKVPAEHLRLQVFDDSVDNRRHHNAADHVHPFTLSKRV